ncbi:MAG TPA: hypothetical protein VIL00_10090 [Pseudonocardiaceae bacterium]
MNAAMDTDELELLITVVVTAKGDPQARAACRDLQERVGGRIVGSADCSDEDPGCWSVTISHRPGERAPRNDASALARAVRSLVRRLGPDFADSRVACEPPTAWTVIDDPELVGRLVPGGERMLVEAWTGGGWLPPNTGTQAPGNTGETTADTSWPEPEDDGSGPRLRMSVDVATDREAGAEWQARAVASRVSQRVTVLGFVPLHNRIRVSLDLGPVRGSAADAVQEAVAALGRPGWGPVGWVGETAVVRWIATPQPPAGITAIELAAGPLLASSVTGQPTAPSLGAAPDGRPPAPPVPPAAPGPAAPQAPAAGTQNGFSWFH